MYKKILVPLDGSKRAEAILPYVESLADRYEAKVILLQVVEPHSQIVNPVTTYPVLDSVRLEEYNREAETYLNIRNSRLREKGIRGETSVSYGNIVEEIIDAAEREDVDLVAMASHGRTGLQRVFYGSVAAGVLHRIDRPLLLIRSEDH